MQNKEIEEAKELLQRDIQSCKDLIDIRNNEDCEYLQNKIKKWNNLLQYIDQLENKVKELEETKDKYLQKLVYALTPTTHELSTNNNNAFKQIIADNIDLETCKIRRKLKEFWGIDKY